MTVWILWNPDQLLGKLLVELSGFCFFLATHSSHNPLVVLCANPGLGTWIQSKMITAALQGSPSGEKEGVGEFEGIDPRMAKMLKGKP